MIFLYRISTVLTLVWIAVAYFFSFLLLNHLPMTTSTSVPVRSLLLVVLNFALSGSHVFGQPTSWTDKNVKISTTGELTIKPSQTSSAHDFDFLEGKWKLDDKKLKSRLSNSTEWIKFESTVEMRKLLNGIGNMDIYKTTLDGKPLEGVALRLFNPETRLWSIYWADSNRGVMDPPMVGSFEGDIGMFYCKDVFKGKPIIVMFHWDKTDKNNPVWSQAFSPDNGVSWEWNATNTSHRVK
ncbi:hypothetical protein QNI19_17865 [Cytophagaceae bacterium DM2B3-1]|uniref:DUF1579 domain-containing protein n=3 Tax=Xanthocytophaga flava TaxID=3048013 RepID=A0ABT7CMP6_9BACT|nr:hypothetical protein [Xanthocytophaga flavus]